MKKERQYITGLNSKVKSKIVDNLKFTIEYADDFIEIGNQEILECDFLNCNFKASQFISDKFINCSFNSVDFLYARFSGSKISNASFKECQFKNTAFIVNGVIVSEIIDSVFENCKFESLVLDYTFFKNCKFIDCSFKKIDFNGSRFENVSFSGKISDSFFRKKILHPPTYKLMNRLIGRVIHPELFQNEMLNIDFTDCVLDGITFCDGVNLSKCKFPTTERYLYISDKNNTYDKALNYINENWEGEEKRLANIVFSSLLMSKYKGQNQINDLVDFDIITEKINGNFSKKIKATLERFSTV